MPPRVTIPSLPQQTAVVDTDLLVVQNGAITKQMAIGLLHDAATSPLTAHIGDAVDAHHASAIAVTPTGGISSTTVQGALMELQSDIDAGGGGGGGGVTPEGAVDAVAAALVAGSNVTIVYDDFADTITIASSGGGGGGVAELPVGGTVGQVLAKQSNINYDVTWNDPAGGGGGGLTSEQIVDLVAGVMTEGVGIDVVYDDAAAAGAGTITITATGVPIANITGLQAALDAKETPAGAAAKVTAHEADTTAVHGIADTTALYRQGGTDVAVADGGTGVSTLATGTFLTGAGTAPVQTTKAVPNGVVVGTTDTQTLTGKSMSGAGAPTANTFTNIPQSAVTGLTTDIGNRVINGGGAATLRALTQAAYDGLGTYDPNTLYIII
jgi:antitoxin (DNA-binding transcriptional repressor) of toxin-antitoxin stability system